MDMKRIISILVLFLIVVLIANNFYVGITYEKPTQKLSYVNYLELTNEKVIRHTQIKKPTKKEKLLLAVSTPTLYSIDLPHNATWYSTDGTRVHRDYPTAAYNGVPRGTKLLVKDTKSGDSCIVEVTDRMGYKGPNHIDLSHMAFGHLAKHSVGKIKVKIKVIE
jgi:rare lipoprotein A (peptidoglycan hydrolase)